MSTGIKLESNTDYKRNFVLAKALRKRADAARRTANIALVLVFVIIFSGIGLFYFAGDIVIQQSASVKGVLF
ncbi:hypothetical protein GKODMF_10475 [Candidatus Electrothrix gigas]